MSVVKPVMTLEIQQKRSSPPLQNSNVQHQLMTSCIVKRILAKEQNLNASTGVTPLNKPPLLQIPTMQATIRWLMRYHWPSTCTNRWEAILTKKKFNSFIVSLHNGPIIGKLGMHRTVIISYIIAKNMLCFAT
jgi:hypothetical protein